MMCLYLVRHGETELNKKGVYFGWTDCELSEEGVGQCERLAVELKEISFDAVISSPLKRAADTARIISDLKNEDILLDERLKEINFGDWEGLHYTEIQINYKTRWDAWAKDWKNFCPPSGESFMLMHERISNFLEELIVNYSDKTVMVVSHEGCMKIIASVLLKMSHDGIWNFAFEHGKYSLFEIVDGHCILKKINCQGEI